jgi:hypothetical protein
MRGEILEFERRRRWSDEEKLTMTISIPRGLVGATIITAALQKRVQFLFENRLNCGADIFSQTILDRIIARFTGQ